MSDRSADCPDENTLLALGRGGLADAERDRVLAHLDGCAGCRKAAAAVAAEVADTDEALIGRYRLRGPLGAGAMGVVFAAYDPELDRDIALKVLRRDRDPHAGVLEQRLVAEARALAKLAHPNVIAAYDVGRHEGEVYLAMELVAGTTLARWLSTKRTRREALAALLQAGEGLAAAHAAGIVHRDFKPENVLVGDDGRVRVTDFGLASGELGRLQLGAGVVFADDDVVLTRTGALAGTPAYMAPEQLDGAHASMLSDQFSFAVAAWSAVYGVRPFAGVTIGELVAAARARRFRVSRADVPTGLRRALQRALAAAPEDRWPELRALLDALAPYARPLNRRWLIAAGVSTIVVGGLVAFGLTRGGAGATCDGSRVASQIWSDDQRAAVEKVFATTRSPYAPAAIRNVDGAFARFRDAWAEAHDEACELGDAGSTRIACLEGQREQVAALARLFRVADAGIVDAATGAAAALPTPARCARSLEPPPDARMNRGMVELADARALRLLGRHQQCGVVAQRVIELATAEGFDELRARALIERGNSREWTGKMDAAIADYKEAIDLAIARHADAVLADALLGLVYATVRAGQLENTQLVADLAAATIHRLGDPTRASALAIALCMRAWRLGKDLDRGRAICEDAYKQARADGGDRDYRLPELATEAGNVAFLQGRYAEAIELYQQSIAGMDRLAGAPHPRSRSARGNLAETYVRLGRHREAAAIYEQLIREEPTAAFHDGLAQARRGLGDHAGALVEHRAAAEAATRAGFQQDRCWGEIGAAEDQILLVQFGEVGATLARAREICTAAGTSVDKGRVELATARARLHAGDREGARSAAAAATRFAIEGGGEGPAKQLADDVTNFVQQLEAAASPRR